MSEKSQQPPDLHKVGLKFVLFQDSPFFVLIFRGISRLFANFREEIGRKGAKCRGFPRFFTIPASCRNFHFKTIMNLLMGKRSRIQAFYQRWIPG